MERELHELVDGDRQGADAPAGRVAAAPLAFGSGLRRATNANSCRLQLAEHIEPITEHFVVDDYVVGIFERKSSMPISSQNSPAAAARNFGLYVAVASITALFSLVIGTVFLFGRAALLPAMLGG
jgi:hypothetical protein